MKSRIDLIGLVLIGMVGISLVLPVNAKDQPDGVRYTVSVVEFENEAGWYGSWNIGDAWGTVLTDMLNQTDQFIVLGESDMRNAAMDEQDLVAAGRTAGGRNAPATGQMTPAQILVKGAITHVQGDTGGGGGGIRIKGFRIGGSGGSGEVNATIYMIDSTTGQVLASKSVVGTHERKGMSVGYATGDWGASFGGHDNDNVGLAVQDACAEAVAFMLEQKGLARADLDEVMGGKSRVSEFLSGKRDLSKSQIEGLRRLLGIPADILLGMNE